MKKKLLCSLAVAALAAAVVISFTSGPAEARPGPIGGPLCGWTAQWECTLPNGDTKFLVGTRCDIFQFEQATGATCTPI